MVYSDPVHQISLHEIGNKYNLSCELEDLHTESVQEMTNKVADTMGIDSFLQTEFPTDEMPLEHILRNAIK